MALGRREVRRRAQLPLANKVVNTVTFTPAANGSNVCEILITPKDARGTTITGPLSMDLVLSDAATGVGLTATTASGAVAVVSTFGTDLGVLTAKKALSVQTNAAGVYKLSITDTAKTAFYIAVNIQGRVFVSSPLITANYG